MKNLGKRLEAGREAGRRRAQVRYGKENGEQQKLSDPIAVKERKVKERKGEERRGDNNKKKKKKKKKNRLLSSLMLNLSFRQHAVGQCKQRTVNIAFLGF